MTEINNVKIDSTIDYKPMTISAPKYVFSKLSPQTGGSSLTLSNTASTETIFDLPAGNIVYNLSRSFLRFVLYEAYDTTAGHFNKLLMDIPPIRRISLYTRNNVMIADIPNFQHFWKMTSNLVTPLDEFQSYPNVGIGATSASAQQAGLCLFHNPNNALNATAPTAHAVNGSKISLAGAVSQDTQRRAYQSQICVMSAGAGDAGATGDLYANCELRLGKIPFSLFNIDKDLFFNEVLQLKVEWDQGTNFGFYGTAVGTLAGATQLVNAPALSGISLYLAVEQNEAIKMDIMNQVLSSGLSMVIPYSNVSQVALGTNTSASVQVKYNRGHGSRLLRIISGEGLNGTLNTRCAMYNLLGASTTTDFYTQLDSIRQEVDNLSCVTNDDYKYIAGYLAGCPLAVVGEYATQAPVYINEFSGVRRMIDTPKEDLYLRGLSLDQERTFNKNINKTATDQICTVIGVTQKVLQTSGQGVLVA